MNKTALRNFAVAARNELIERVELQALKIGVSKEKNTASAIESSDAIIINGKTLTDIERRQRNQLINQIEAKGYDQVIEEVSYTWFNRFVALRFMEVNDYLPTRVRVLSSENPANTEPDMIKEALTLDLDIDKEKIFDWKMNNNTEELFKYLILLHCNDLNKYMPFMFETLEDYTMILFPEGLLGTESFVREMIDTEVIPEDNWEEVEIVGWLYQFYIAEEKDRVFKEKKKYKSSDIPFATQLFTPKWIVKYMVQNSLGKYWIESHPEDEQLTDDWDFYIQNTDEEYEKIKAGLVNSELSVEEIKCFDPAMGSGHILVYMFDVLHEIYTKRGYMSREIPKLIIENNLYGLDIDERAYQLAGFSIIMKALEYNRRFLRTIERDGLTLNIAAIEESNSITEKHIDYLDLEDKELVEDYMNQFKDAKSIGSLLKLADTDISEIENKTTELVNTPVKSVFDENTYDQVLHYLPKLLKQTKIMQNRYDIIVTNPPYMSRASMNKELTTYLDKNYPDSKADLFATFMELEQYIKESGFYSMINQHSWMFTTSYEKLRKKIINNKYIESMLHLGSRAFREIGGEVVQSTAFVLRQKKQGELEGLFIRLINYNNSADKEIKALEAIHNPNALYRYRFNQNKCSNILGVPIAYWANKNIINTFTTGISLKDIMGIKSGLVTGNNELFQRLWFEIKYANIGFNYSSIENTSDYKHRWFPCSSGGSYRKWFTNDEYVVNWEGNGREIRKYKNPSGKLAGRPQNTAYYFKEGITWNKIGSSNFSVKHKERGFIFDDTSRTAFLTKRDLLYVIGLLTSKISFTYLKILNPTMSFTNNDIARIPLIESTSKPLVEEFVLENIEVSKNDWHSFEISWGFEKHPLLKHLSNTIESSFNRWKNFSENQFNQLKSNEEELNRIFIEIYGLEDELTPEVADKDVTVRKADLERDIKSFISYAVGCALGRYSLDEDGLIYAGGEFEGSRYQTFPADKNNILPILSDAYFEDDIVSLFIHFVEIVYGSETLEENLTFVAEAIGKRKSETARAAIRRYFLNNYYKDHVQTYKKHPIYWQFTSGKEKAFNCLIYMHRYDKTTLSRIRTDYLHDVQARYETIKNDLQYVIDSDASAKEIRDAKKELTSVDKKITELKAYDEKLHHMADMQIEIDLDDGVKVNYKKFEGLVAKI